VELLYKALAFRPDSADYRAKLGMALAAAGRNDEALEALDSAIERDAGQGVLAEAHHNRGVVLDRLGRADEAVAAWKWAVELRPGYDEALNLLGQKLLVRNQAKEALVPLGGAVRANPRNAAAHNNLGIALRKEGDLAKAASHFRRAAVLRPGHAEAHSNLGTALNELGRPAEAVPHLEKAAELRPDFTDAHWNLALSLLSLGDFDRGWLEYEWRRHLPADVPLHRPFRQPEWNGCNISGRTLLVASEQGLGDTLQFIRYVPLLARRGATVVLECQPALRELLATLEGATQVVARGEPLPRFDAHVRLLSLPGIMGTRLGNVPADGPYLRADDRRVDEWKRRLDEVALGFAPGFAGVGTTPLFRSDGEAAMFHHPRNGRALPIVAEPDATEEQGNAPSPQPSPGDLSRSRHEPSAHPQPMKIAEDEHASACHPESSEGSLPFGTEETLRFAQGDGYSRQFSIFIAVPGEGERGEKTLAHARGSLDAADACQSLESRPTPGQSGAGDRDASGGACRRAAPDRSTVVQDGNGAPALPSFPRIFRVGIAWQGNPTFPNDRERSVPLVHFAPLAAVPGVRLYSLQKNHGVEQLAEARKKFPIVDFAPPLDEGCGAFMDTAAVIANLDLVVSSDTSMVHLAGALGMPVWMATSHACDWCWLRDRDDSPWYPTLRLFRQERPGDWPAVFRRMAHALRDMLASPDRPRPAREPASVPMAPSDLIDRLTILQIKCERLSDPVKLRGIRAELEALRTARERSLPGSDVLQGLTRELRLVNEELWAIEDDIRLCERAGDFGPRFIELARSVYRTNDRRADLKRRVNAMLGSPMGDEKQYQAYD
jgi:Flp pilus assembly protein TadD